MIRVGMPIVRAAFAVAASVFILVAAGPASAQQCRELRFAFQPDCYRPSLSSACNKAKTGDQLDLKPQVAVWLTNADGTTFVDSLMVTSLTARRGLGNRPGVWNFRSSPKFPYGKRVMALPVWAHARGRLYDVVVMQDGAETGMGFHEAVSSPDPYYCRPMSDNEIDVDAVTCPTQVFNSSKGRFMAGTKTYYPPRRDLTAFTERDCNDPQSFGSASSCTKDATRFAALNELDAVSAATPSYGNVYKGRWAIPQQLPPGDYVLMVEVSKEFDYNASHSYPSFQDPALRDSGMPRNIGQPSVVYRVPVRLDGSVSFGSADEIAGYGAPDGSDGRMRPRDSTISTTPGSGEGRLLTIASPWPEVSTALGRVHVSTGLCGGEPDPVLDGGADAGGDVCANAPAPTPPTILDVQAVSSEQVIVSFTNGGDGGQPVAEYQIYAREGTFPFTDEDLTTGAPAEQVTPGPPGSAGIARISGLKGEKSYTIGMRARGRCFQYSSVAQRTFETPARKFTQLSGCFIATAAYGSALEPSVGVLRHARDRLVAASGIGRASVDLYYRSSPPVAAVLAESDAARAAVRRVLAPFVGLAESVEKLHASR